MLIAHARLRSTVAWAACSPCSARCLRLLSGSKRATTACTHARTTAILQPRRRPPHERNAARGSLLLLLLLFELLLLLQLVLTFLLRFFGGLLLARFDVGFVLGRIGLLLLEALLLLYRS